MAGDTRRWKERHDCTARLEQSAWTEMLDLPDALAAIPDRELHALRDAIEGSPNIVPGLLAWLEGATDWELNRRAGFDYELLGPSAAIDDSELGCSLPTLAVLSAQFRDDGRAESAPVADFLDCAAAVLRAEVERPDALQ